MSGPSKLSPCHAPPGIDEQAWSVLTPDVRRTRVSAGQRVRASDVEPSLTFFPISLLLSFVSPQSGVEILSLGAGGTSVPDLLLGSDALGLDAVVTVEGEAWSIPTSILRQLAAEHPPVEKAMRAQGGLALREAVRHAEERTRSLQISNLARWLSRAVALTGQTSFALTHETLARLLGTRRTSVTEGLAYLADRRFLLIGRRWITVADAAGLERQSRAARGNHALPASAERKLSDPPLKAAPDVEAC
jgi:CRP-like cAMP-binding protein